MPADLSWIIAQVRAEAYNITVHGYEEIDNDGITVEMLEEAICHDMPEVIEDYPTDPRGACCLILARTSSNMSIHVVIGYAGHAPGIITVYLPDPTKWMEGFRRRR